jgi:3-dehydroquinate synthase
MQAIEVRAERDYAIEVGVNWQEVVASIIAQHSRLIIFAPAFILEKFSLQDFASEKVELHCLPDGEEQKNVEQWQLALKHCGDLGLTRSDAVVAIGGGATTDFTGFVGASWLRGIAWYAIPTTLAAMVDAAIGGKTGLNSVHGKNLIGSFYSPAGVYIDPAFLETLSDRDLAAGLAEVIKTGLIGEAKILDLLERTPDLQGVREIATELIALAAAFKARIVSGDFREGRLREILNYGHTLGHAIEKAENYTLRHGEAVAIGLVFAAELSAIAAGLDTKAVSLHRSLLTRYGLPISYEPSALSALLETMRGDKKSRGDQMRFIGLESLGNPVWLEEVTIDQITAAYGKISS